MEITQVNSTTISLVNVVAAADLRYRVAELYELIESYKESPLPDNLKFDLSQILRTSKKFLDNSLTFLQEEAK